MTPPPLHLWMEAVLLLCVSLVQSAASTLKMIFNRKARDWHADDAQEDLPQATSSNHAPKPILRDDRRFAPIPQDEVGWRFTKGNHRHKRETNQALILRDREAIVSKDGGVLTALSPLIPTNVGIQGRPRTPSRLAASSLRPQQSRSWIPTLILSLSKDVGMSGAMCGKPRATSA